MAKHTPSHSPTRAATAALRSRERKSDGSGILTRPRPRGPRTTASSTRGGRPPPGQPAPRSPPGRVHPRRPTPLGVLPGAAAAPHRPRPPPALVDGLARAPPTVGRRPGGRPPGDPPAAGVQQLPQPPQQRDRVTADPEVAV